MKYSKIFAIIFLILIMTGCQAACPQEVPPKAKQGILDLRDWDFKKDGPVDLKGQWEFYWNKFIVSDRLCTNDTIKPDGYINVPSDWRDFKLPSGESIGRMGFCSYRLRILLPPEVINLLIDVKFIYSAHKTFLIKSNGSIEKIKSAGLTGKNKKSEIPHIIPYTFSFDGLNELILVHEVSNFRIYRCGLSYASSIGLTKQIFKKIEKEKSIDFFIIGCIFIIGLYNLILFVLYPSEKAPLWLSLLCLLITIMSYLQKGYFHFTDPSSILFDVHIKLWYISGGIAPIIMTAFTYSVFRKFFKNKIRLLIYAIGGSLAIFTVIAPVEYGTAIVPFEQTFICLVSFYVIGKLLQIVVQDRNLSALISFSGFSLVIFSGINDVLYAHNLIPTNYIIHFGLLGFIVCQAFIVARENAISRRNAEIYSIELDKKEKQLRLLIGNLKSVVYRFSNNSDLTIDFLSNGCHDLIGFRSEGGVIIIYAEKNNDSIVIKVIDNGYGIPEWAQEKIFDQFFQADYIMSEKVRGSGLGLTIAQEIVEQHNGKMNCSSPILPDEVPVKNFQLTKERKGSMFIIELPCQ